jgi:hypothetical protein
MNQERGFWPAFSKFKRLLDSRQCPSQVARRLQPPYVSPFTRRAGASRITYHVLRFTFHAPGMSRRNLELRLQLFCSETLPDNLAQILTLKDADTVSGMFRPRATGVSAPGTPGLKSLQNNDLGCKDGQAAQVPPARVFPGCPRGLS